MRTREEIIEALKTGVTMDAAILDVLLDIRELVACIDLELHGELERGRK